MIQFKSIKKLLTDGSWVTGTNIIMALMSLLYIVVLTHIMSVETLGVYQFVLAFVATTSVFSLSGFSTAVFQSASKGFINSYNQANKIRLKVSTIGSIALTLSAFYFKFMGKDF